MPSKRRFHLRGAHRWFGLVLLPPLFALVATGILLNHTGALDLDQKYVDSKWLMNLYGIRPQPPETGFAVGERWISHARDTIFLDDRVIGESPEPVVGAARMENMLAIATPGRLFLYTPDGRTVDTLDLPIGIQPAKALALVDGRPVVSTPYGPYWLNPPMTAWSGGLEKLEKTIPARPLPARLRTEIADRLTATTLSWERVLLDLHGGRVFGRLGPWLMDVVALTVLVLATTGCLMWLRVVRGRKYEGR